MSIQSACVIGLGYIGLPTAAVLANCGLRVFGVDVNSQVIETINQGKIHIKEPALDLVVQSVVKKGKLTASLQPAPADVFIIAVPTPFTEKHKPDVSYVEAAALAIAPYLQSGNLVILESTSPVDTTEQLSRWLAKCRPDLTFPHDHNENATICVAYCPERVLPGNIMNEIVNNDRIIGGLSPCCAEKASAFYQRFVKGECIKTSAAVAAMSKLTENAFRDVNIAFANELSLLCEAMGIDVWELIQLANRHPRVNILQPGPGVGGHCIAVDPWFIVDACPEQAKLIRMAREVNDAKPDHVIEKVKSACEGMVKPKIACLGLAFKPDIDDLRESPAVKIVEALAVFGEVLAVEPNISQLPQNLKKNKNIALFSLEKALLAADLVLILVKHKLFLEYDFSTCSQKVIDMVNIKKNRSPQKIPPYPLVRKTEAMVES